MSVVNKTYEINIAAGESLLLQSGGRYAYCESANLAKFRIAIDDVAEGVIGPGLGYERDADEEPFSRVRVVNDTASALAGTIVIGTGRILDNRLTLTGAVAVSNSATLATAADVALVATVATEIVAANAARREIIIHNNTGAAIRVGDVNVAAARGVEIAAGAVLVMATAAAVYGYSVAGGDVSFTEVRD